MNITPLIKVTDRVYYYPGDADTDRPYLYYIKGDNYSVAVDAGYSEGNIKDFYQALTDAGLPLPQYTVLTHWHWDHSFGLAYIQGTSIAGQLTTEKLHQVTSWIWTPEAMKKREESGEDISFCNENIIKVYPDLSEIKIGTIDKVITGEEVLDAGGIHIHLIPHDSTHTRDALFIYVPEEKALFVGDADGEDLYDNHGEIDQARLLPMIEFIESFDFEHYFLGHDEPDAREGVLKYLNELKK